VSHLSPDTKTADSCREMLSTQKVCNRTVEIRSSTCTRFTRSQTGPRCSPRSNRFSPPARPGPRSAHLRGCVRNRRDLRARLLPARRTGSRRLAPDTKSETAEPPPRPPPRAVAARDARQHKIISDRSALFVEWRRPGRDAARPKAECCSLRYCQSVHSAGLVLATRPHRRLHHNPDERVSLAVRGGHGRNVTKGRWAHAPARRKWSGRPDLNWRPLGPEPSALPG
jgi:hypothetical protein